MDGFAPIVLTCVTHLPNENGYHKQRLKVIQTCLTTMRQNARREDIQVMVWDNGSCRMLVDWLEWEYKPDYLIRSANIGKTAARSSMFRMIPPKTIVGYCDDDMYFYPGWLTPQLDLLQTFPDVAQVSGYPVRTQFRFACDRSIAWAHNEKILEVGRFIPREWENDFCKSIGRDPVWHAEEWTPKDQDYKAAYNGLQAYLTSHHCQFIGYQDILAQAVHYDGQAMGDERPIEEALNKLGLRLTTISRLTRHIGNVPEEHYA